MLIVNTQIMPGRLHHVGGARSPSPNMTSFGRLTVSVMHFSLILLCRSQYLLSCRLAEAYQPTRITKTGATGRGEEGIVTVAVIGGYGGRRSSTSDDGGGVKGREKVLSIRVVVVLFFSLRLPPPSFLFSLLPPLLLKSN